MSTSNDRQALLGGAFLEAAREAFERVQETPRGTRLEGVVRELEVRSVRMRKPFPFRVYFVDFGHEVRIYAVAHLKRRPG